MNASQINQSVDLVTLAGGDTRLQRRGAYHVGPCPFCGGRDRFTVKRTPRGDHWHCRKCASDRYHSPIDYVMRRDGLDFPAALAHLEGAGHPEGAGFQPAPTYRGRESAAQPAPKCRGHESAAHVVPDAAWRDRAQREVDAASERLLGDNPIGRDYLARRGLHRGTWLAWHLGLADVYDPSVGRTRPAIVIPWLGTLTDTETITAIKYRFIDAEPGRPRYISRPEKPPSPHRAAMGGAGGGSDAGDLSRRGLRYISKRGSAPILFGLWSLVPRHHTLLLVEGELNALSVWQCLPDGVSCLSFGSETGWRPGVLRDVARGVRRVLVWADDPARASQMRLALGGQVQALRSSSTNGRKWDANMLLQHGRLMQFLETLLGVPCLGRVDTASPISRPRLAASAKGRGTDHNQRKRAASR